jgi:hypothetical protein
MIGIRDALRNLFSSSYVESNMPSQESEAGMSTPSHQIVEVQVSKVCNLQHNISETEHHSGNWQVAFQRSGRRHTDKGLEVEALNEMMEISRLTWVHRESHVRPP